MKTVPSKTKNASPLTQFVVNFAIPIVILTRFSSESQLGATKSLLLALAFPVAFELYNIRRSKKISALSIIAIGGILVTGGISLLGLSEGWLAIRRSVPYLAVAAALIISMQIKRPLLSMLLPQIIDMDQVNKAAGKKKTMPDVQHSINFTSYIISSLFIFISAVSYVLTRVVIISPTNTTGFNQEYARLRILSLPFTTLPLLIGAVVAIMYLLTRIEKLTGLEIDELIKKKK